MGLSTVATSSLHAFTQALLVPIIGCLALLILFAAFSIGSVIAEWITVWRHARLNPVVLAKRIGETSRSDLGQIIESAALTEFQKRMAYELLSARELSHEAQEALARRLLEQEETRLTKRVALTDIAMRLGPMLGLMGTLVPLGPGIMSLSEGDMTLLASALTAAFDTTVAGLLAAGICLALSKVRSLWYADAMATAEALMAALLDRLASPSREDVVLSSGYAAPSSREGMLAPSAYAAPSSREGVPSSSGYAASNPPRTA